MFAGGDQTSILGRVSLFFSPGNAPYLILYALLIIMFTYFYTAVQFNPVEHADNLKKSGGYFPRGKPGARSGNYPYQPLAQITPFGAPVLAPLAAPPSHISPAFGLG